MSSLPKNKNLINFDYSDIDLAFWKLEYYISTWQRDDGSIAGLIATFWDWSNKTIKPHVMNHFPIVLGYLNLYKKFKKNIYLEKAKNIANFFITIQDESGMYKNAWGDIPNKRTGPILQICPNIALLELYRITGNIKYLETVKKNISWLFKNLWDGKGFYGYVVNQTCKSIEMLLLLYEIEKVDKYKELALKLGDWVLTQQAQCDIAKGGFYQSKHDDRLFLVYNGKCISALIKLFLITKDDKYKQSLENLIEFILRNRENKKLFYSHLEFNISPFLKFELTYIYKLTKFIALFRDYLRRFKRTKLNYRIQKYPIWIARSANIIDGLIEASAIINIEQYILDNLIKTLIGYQYKNGGFPNTIGYFGDDKRVSWQDVVCPIRWNAYTFLLLSKLVTKELNMKDDFPIIEKEFIYNGTRMLFKEKKDRVEFWEGDKIKWLFNKKEDDVECY